MTTKQPAIVAPLQFPNELCREIIDKLHYRRDRCTLLCLALVNRAWSTESQRMLFSIVDDDSTDTGKRESLIQIHILFLKSVILNPSRLALYVGTYKQHGLIRHPQSKIPDLPATRYLWDLTARALPALVNLKHLLLKPSNSYGEPLHLGVSLLIGCPFKLKSLRWEFNFSTSSIPEPFLEFLRTQRDLLHLEVGSLPTMQDLSWLPRGACPNLISASCRLDTAAHVMDRRRHMVGLAGESQITWPLQQAQPHNHLSGLHHLKYLALTGRQDPMSLQVAIDSPIILLELLYWNLETIRSLAGFVNLRILALLRTRREGPSSGIYDNASQGIDVKAEYNLRMQLAIESFRQCPNLEYVVIEDIDRGYGSKRFRKLTISAPIDESDAPPDVQSEEFSIEHVTGSPWWTAYGV